LSARVASAKRRAGDRLWTVFPVALLLAFGLGFAALFATPAVGQQSAPATRNRTAAPQPALAPAVTPAPAASPPAHSAAERWFRESVAIETNLTAQRQLELARQYLAEKRWSQGIELIRQVAANASGSLIAIGPGRYVSVDLYGQMLMAGLPTEGLAVARKTLDDSAKTAFDDAVAHRDEAALRALVHKMFVAHSAEPALLTLGQWAWESGNLTAARGYWSQLLPLPDAALAEPADTVLRYPDPQTEPAEIAARLVMTSIVAGDWHLARFQLAGFRHRFGQAHGRLGDREGILADLLAESAGGARDWSFPPRDTAVATFGINAARNGVLPQEIEVGAARWSTELPADLYAPVHALVSDREPLTTYPVVYNHFLIVNTAEQILAWDVRTGKPAWADDRGENPAIYSGTPDVSAPSPPPFLVGTPRYTMTIDDGRLYARMGDPTTVRPRSTLHESDSSIVCLDLKRGEGKLAWKIDASSLDPQSAFEGSPLVSHGRAYLAVRKGRPRMQTEVVCLEADSGRRLWSRTVCAAVEDVAQNASLLSHQLLTAGDDALFLATGLGAIAAVEAEDGALRWIVTYESGDRDSSSLEPERRENSPCLFAQNIVVAAPGDSKTLLAIDSRSGTPLWRRVLSGGVNQLLGTKDGTLIVSGQSLWGLDLATGRIEWQLGFTDPASFGFGRGLLAGDIVYWPTREDIYVVDQATGRVRRRIPLLARYVESGGNLVLAGDYLAIAQSRRLVVFGPAAGLPLQKKQALPPTLTQHESSNVFAGGKTGLSSIFEPR
jgi:outer membrane protein assembly factor BamB